MIILPHRLNIVQELWLMLFFSDDNCKSKAITIIQEFLEPDFGLIEAWLINDDARKQYLCSANFNLIVEFTSEKEQFISRLSNRLLNETAPLTVRVFTKQEAEIFLPEKLIQLFSHPETRHEVAATIERSPVFMPIVAEASSMPQRTFP